MIRLKNVTGVKVAGTTMLMGLLLLLLNTVPPPVGV
jgi:hypothetical protein